MNYIKRFLQNSCVFTVVISFLFILFAKIVNVADAKFGAMQFLTMFLFGIVISLANFILSIKRLHVVLRVLIHYLLLFAAFIVIFVINGSLVIKGAAVVFVALVLYTILYAVIFVSTYYIGNALTKVDSKLDKKVGDKKKSNSYTPRFK